MKGTTIKKLIVAFFLFLSATVHAQTASDTTTIQNILAEEVTSWNKGDAITYSKHFATDGTFTNILGMFFTGHKAFLDRHIEIFNGRFRQTTLRQNTVSLRFVKPDVAIVETLTCINGFSKDGPPPGVRLDAEGRLLTRLLQVMVKDGGVWKITVYHNTDIKPGTTIPTMK